MATFNAKITGVDALIRKFEQAPQKMMEQSKVIIDETVVEIARSAKGLVPVKTGHLRGSIRSNKYTPGKGASVSAGNVSIKYAPYVEFGTGDKFQIPVYPNVNMTDLEAYAATFKRTKKVNLPHRPFMFMAYSELLGKMVNKLKKVRI